ncbi:hypothetical protein SFRURICE_014926 [Spodoptera frugiperda]|nr:hypothetical protein SFRURICE_014926 [Spodoptera frugiperda]
MFYKTILQVILAITLVFLSFRDIGINGLRLYLMNNPDIEEDAYVNTEKRGCYLDELQAYLPFDGMIQVPQRCYVAHCFRNGLKFSACGVQADHPDCNIRYKNTSKSYPECCENIECLRDAIANKRDIVDNGSEEFE